MRDGIVYSGMILCLELLEITILKAQTAFGGGGAVCAYAGIPARK